MRREIKFRAWDDQNKFWVDRCIIENDGEVAVLDYDTENIKDMNIKI